MRFFPCQAVEKLGEAGRTSVAEKRRDLEENGASFGEHATPALW
jgi:hypothetical protein